MNDEVKELIFDSVYNFTDKNNLFNNTQSGFTHNYSCIHQFIVITDRIFSAFNANLSLEVCGIFLNLSKVFDKFWHDGLLYKLKSKGIDDNLFKLIKWLLNNRCQWVVLNGQFSV